MHCRHWLLLENKMKTQNAFDIGNLFAGIDDEVKPAKSADIDTGNLFAGLNDDTEFDTNNLFSDISDDKDFDPKNIFAGIEDESNGFVAQVKGRDAIKKDDDEYTKGLTRVMGNIGGVVGKTLMALDAPRSAIAAAVGTAMGKNELSDVVDSLTLKKNVSWGDLMPDIKISRDKVPTGMNVLGVTMEQLRGGTSPDYEDVGDLNLKPLVGFAADVLLDPINLVGVGVLTKEGDAAKLLTSVADGLVTNHLDDIIGATKLGDDFSKVVNAAKANKYEAISALRGKVIRELSRGNEKLVEVMLDLGYPTEVINAAVDAAKNGVHSLGSNIAAQAKKGQWSALRFAGIDTPKKFNEVAANIMSEARRAVANSPIGAGRFSTKTGNEVIDRKLLEVENIHRKRNEEILEAGRQLRKKLDELTPEAFNGRSSVDWYERIGGLSIPKKDETVDAVVEAVKTPKTTALSTRWTQIDKDGMPIRNAFQLQTSTVGDAGKLTPDEKKLAMAREVAELQERQSREMLERGILDSKIEEKGYAYVPHVAREEGVVDRIKTAIFGERTGGKGRPTTKTPHALEREFRWITDPETGKEVIDSVSRFAEAHQMKPEDVYKISRQASVDEINRHFGKDFMVGDIAEATTIAALRNERALHGARQIQSFLDIAKRRVREVGGTGAAEELGWRRPKLDIPKTFLMKDGKVFPIKDGLTKLQEIPMEPAVRRLVEGRWRTIAQPEESVKALRSMWQGYIGAWKRYTLFPFLEYHTRNVVGDLWNGWMQGWKPSQMAGDLIDAKDILLAEKKLGRGTASASTKTLNLPAYGKMDPEDVLRAAKQYGVIGSGQYGEIIKDAVKPASKTTLGWFKKHFWDIETPVQIGSFLEDQRRLGFFLRRLREGDTFQDAAKTVSSTLYDYGDLTGIERQIRTLAIPFYSWYRKNIPKQIENMIRHPGKVAVLPKAKAHLEKSWMVDPDNPRDNTAYEKSVPNWMEASLPIRWRQDDQGFDEFFVLGNWIPTADLFRFVSNPRDIVMNIVGNLNPPVQKAIEHTFNKDVFRDRPLDFLRDNEAGVFEEGAPFRGNERTNYLGKSMRTTTVSLMQLLPIARLLSTLDRINPGGVFDEEGREGLGAAGQAKRRPYHVEMGSIQKWMKVLTGIKSYPVDTQAEVLYRAMDLQRSRSGEGLTRENLRAMIRKANREGDEQALKAYEILAELLSNRLYDIDSVTTRARNYMREQQMKEEEKEE